MSDDNDVEELMEAIIREHNDIYHPGLRCASNEDDRCVDAFGGTRQAGWLGEYLPEGPSLRPGAKVTR